MTTVEPIEDVGKLFGSPVLGLVKALIWKFRLREDKEDTLQDILLHLHSTGYLGDYDPDYDAGRGASFVRYLYAFVKYELMNKKAHETSELVKRVEAPSSLDAPLVGTDDLSLLKGLSSDGTDKPPLSGYPEDFQLAVQELLNRLLNSIDKREATVLRLRYGLNGKQKRPVFCRQIAKRLSISHETIRSIERRALEKLNALLITEEGPVAAEIVKVFSQPGEKGVKEKLKPYVKLPTKKKRRTQAELPGTGQRRVAFLFHRHKGQPTPEEEARKETAAAFLQ